MFSRVYPQLQGHDFDFTVQKSSMYSFFNQKAKSKSVLNSFP